MLGSRTFAQVSDPEGEAGICNVKFILSYLKEHRIPILPTKTFNSLIHRELLSEYGGSSASVHLYDWPVSIELQESGFYDPIEKKAHTTFSKKSAKKMPHIQPLRTITVPIAVKKLSIRRTAGNPHLAVCQFLNELTHLGTFSFMPERMLTQLKNRQTEDPYYSIDPHIISCYGCYFEVDQRNVSAMKLWIFLEYAEAGPLTQAIQNLTLAERIQASKEICEALYGIYTHNTVHGDLKLDNVFYSGHKTLLGDFGNSMPASHPFYFFSQKTLRAWGEKHTPNEFQHTPALVELPNGQYGFVLSVKESSALAPKTPEEIEKYNAVAEEIFGPPLEKSSWLSKWLPHAHKKNTLVVYLRFPVELNEDLIEYLNVHPEVWSEGKDIKVFLVLESDIIMRYLRAKHYGIKEGLSGSLIDYRCVGTPAALAPELGHTVYGEDESGASSVTKPHQSIKPITPNLLTDHYSLGILLSHLWTGQEPYCEQTAISSPQLVKKVVEENLRPRFETLFSEQGKVNISELPPNDKALELKNLLEECGHPDPDKRPDLKQLIDFFREWRKKLIIQAVSQNNEDLLKEFLQNLCPSQAWVFQEMMPWKDHESRPGAPLTPLQYSLWAGSPFLQVLVNRIDYFPEMEKQSQELPDSPWVQQNGPQVETWLEKLMQLYDRFEVLCDQSEKKKYWNEIGQAQRKLPPYLVLDYLKYCHAQSGQNPSSSKGSRISAHIDGKNTVSGPKSQKTPSFMPVRVRHSSRYSSSSVRITCKPKEIEYSSTSEEEERRAISAAQLRSHISSTPSNPIFDSLKEQKAQTNQEQLEKWYAKPEAKIGPQGPPVIFYTACYYNQTLCRHPISQLDPEPQFKGFCAARERQVTKQLLEDVSFRRKRIIQDRRERGTQIEKKLSHEQLGILGYF